MNYDVEGNEALEDLEQNLAGVEERTGNVNEATEVARERFKKYQEGLASGNQEATRFTQKQFDIADAVSQSNEVVREVTLGAELLRLEYEQGEITQEQFSQGMGELSERLEGLDVVTLQSARTMRRLNAEQSQTTAGMKQMDGGMNRATMTAGSMTRMLSSMQGGFRTTATQLPVLVRQFTQLGQSSGGALGALRSMGAFLMSPAGIIVALGALIPLIVSAGNRFGWFKTVLFDTEEAGKDWLKTWEDIMEQFERALGLEGSQALSFRLQEVQRELDEIEDSGGRQLRWWEKVSLQAGSVLGFTQRIRNTSRQILTTSEEIGSRVNALEERRAELQARIVAQQRIENDNRLELIQLTTRMLELTAEADKRWEEEMANWQGIEEEIIDGSEETQARLDQQVEDTAKKWAEIGRERIAFEQELSDMRFQNKLAEASQMLSLDLMEEQRRLEIMNNEVLTTRQQQEALFEIEREFSRRRQELVEEEEAMKRMERQITFDMGVDLLQSLDGFGEVIFGQSEERAKQAFQFNKAMNLLTATVAGARAVVEALPNVKRALLVGAMAGVQIAKIASTQWRPNASGSGQSAKPSGFSHDFRGLQSDTIQGRAEAPRMPDTIRLEDSGGRFLTRLQWAKDKEAEQTYLID